MTWVFGDYELDDDLYQLRRRGRVIPMEPLVFDVFVYLVRNRERVVTKRELLDALWPGEAVSDSVLPRCIAASRRAVRDNSSRQRVIQTVHGRGYRFVATSEAREKVSKCAAPTGRALASPPALKDFVGRELAMTKLRAAHAEITRSRARLVFLVGEPGIGKTRTTEELGVEVEDSGTRWIAGRCAEGEGSPPFWPWLQILRTLLTSAELEELLPRLGPASDRGTSSFDGEQVRFRLFDAIAQHLSGASRRQPLLVTLDDLHWADADSLRLLDFVAGELRSERILFLVSYRDVEVRRDHGLGRLLGGLTRQPHCERISLRGLERDEVGALVEAMTGAPAKIALVDAVTDMTEGNPFFVREIIGWLAEEGRLGEEPNSEEPMMLPEGVRDAVGRRLDSLSGPCNEVLRAASVLGREFDTRLLERVTDHRGEDLLELLGEAEAAGVIQEDDRGPGRFSFSHALVRQTLYEELRAPQRVALHRRVGDAMREFFENRPEVPTAELAHHYFEAAASGAANEAIEWSVQAAKWSHGLCAYEESARHYERALLALDFVGEPDPERRCELLIAWADELRTGGAREAGRTRFSEAADLARALNRSDLLARAAIGFRGFGEMAAPADAETVSLMEEARDALGDQHPLLRAQLLARLAGTPPYSLSMANREALSQEAFALAQSCDDPAVLTDAIGARYWATLGPDRIEERLEVSREALALAARWDDRRIALIGHEIEVGAYLMLGDRSRFDEALNAYTELADEIRQPAFSFIASMIEASRAMNLGNFEESESLIRRALKRGHGSVAYAEFLFAAQVYWLSHQRGELERVAPGLVQMSELIRATLAGMGPLIDVLMAVGQASQGDLDLTRERFGEIKDFGLENVERDEHWLACMASIAELAILLEDRACAEQLYDLLAPYEQLFVSHDLLRTAAGTVHTVLGQLAHLLGRHEVAVVHLIAATEKAKACGALPALFAAQSRLAQALEARGSAGDEPLALSVRAEAERGLERLGSRLPGLMGL